MQTRIKSKMKYPIRVLVGYDENGGGLYHVFQSFELYPPLTDPALVLSDQAQQSLSHDKRVMLVTP